MKVNQNKEFVLPVLSEGAHLETSSPNELWLVKKMWEQGQFSNTIKVLCNGPKTNQYISLIEELKLKNLDIIPIVENWQELDYLRSFKGDIGIRIEPNVKVSSHWDKQTDQFGLPMEAVKDIGRVRNLKILSYHAGSQITKLEDLISPIRKVMNLYIKLKKDNPQLGAINIGGGFAVPYEKNKKMYSMENTVKKIIRAIKSTADKAHINHPDIIVEWGRYLAAPAQITIYKIIAQKDIIRENGVNNQSGAKKWYFIDGSFQTDLLDTWAIHQKWHIVPVNNMNCDKFMRVWLAGCSCDSDDKYTNGGSYILLPRVEENATNGQSQYVMVLDTGAYQDAFANHHCLISSPTKIIAQNGVITVARKKESAEEVGKKYGW
jgi:arginine decarboxylase